MAQLEALAFAAVKLGTGRHCLVVSGRIRKRTFESGASSEPVPSEADGLVAEIDTALEEQILNVPQPKWEAHIHHHHEADHIRR